MELYLQIGHGMMAHCLELNNKWNGATCILSPKNMSYDQMIKFSNDINNNNGNILLDPQFYVPRSSRELLNEHSFWPSSYTTDVFFNGQGISNMLSALINDYNNPLNTSAFILPSLYLSDINDDWNRINEIILNEAAKVNITIPKYFTLCIGEEILKNEEKTHRLLEYIADYPVDGFYIIPVHPNNIYLIDNVSWLINLMDLLAGIKLYDKKTIVGYSNHQLLLLALAKVDAICSGIWLKTRLFPLGDFNNDDEQKGGRRSPWYYCPQALSEYQLQFLDIAHSCGILDDMKTDKLFNSDYTDILFKGAQPTIINFSEREAFRHYLQCLNTQCKYVSKDSYEETKKYLTLIFETAIDLTNYFRTNGVRGKHRDFNNVGESNLSVIDAFENLRGLVFKSMWNSI